MRVSFVAIEQLSGLLSEVTYKYNCKLCFSTILSGILVIY